MSTPMIRLWYAITALIVACVVIAGVSIQYANYVDQKSNQRWCEMLSTLDDAYKDNPPQTPTGRKVAADTARLRKDFGCGTQDDPKG